MSRLEISCQTASTSQGGIEIKASQMLLESTVYLDPRKIPTAESMESIREQFSRIATHFALPEGEVCTCSIELVD